MRYWQTLTLASTLAMLAACSNDGSITEQVCRAEYRYNTTGVNSAITTILEMGDEEDYAVGINYARFLILRGASTHNVNDFDKAKSVLDSTEMPRTDNPLFPHFASVLRFVALANGSNSSGARRELAQYCQDATEPELECLKSLTMEVFDWLGTSDGTKNKSSKEFAELFNQTYYSVFDDPTLDVVLDYSRSVVTSCGTRE